MTVLTTSFLLIALSIPMRFTASALYIYSYNKLLLLLVEPLHIGATVFLSIGIAGIAYKIITKTADILF